MSDRKPIISSDVFLAPNASLIGNVEVQSSASVWYGAVIRADTAPISIGERASIGDRSVVRGASSIGAGTTILPGAVVEGAEIGENSVIGSGAVVMPGAVIGAFSVVRPGSFVPEGCSVPAGEIWAGTPAEKVDVVGESLKEEIVAGVEDMGRLASAHAVECGKTHEQIEAEKLRQALLEERSDDYNSHLGLLGKEREIVEVQAIRAEEEVEAQRKVGAL